MTAKVTIQRGNFERTLASYMLASKKDLATVLNQKGFWIIIKAAKFTKVADKTAIRKWMRSKDGQNWIGSLFGRKRITHASRKEATKKMISSAISSVAYIKSGWITPAGALKKTGGVKGKFKVGGAKQRKGQRLGRSKPAKKTFSPLVEFHNLTGAQSGSDKKTSGQKHSQSEAAKQFGEPALRKAFTSEKASMQRYLLKKMRETARRKGMA